MPSASVIRDAQVLWEFHQMPDERRATDIAIGLGGHDISVAEHAADLYRQGRFPLVVFTGANAPTTLERFPRGEAVHFAERAETLGVPPEAIVLETKATNTSENFTFTRELLLGRGLDPKSATIISRPYQGRRAWATVRKVWPELEVVCSARWLALEDYIASIGDEQRVLNMLVGDTQRLWAYADAGFAVPVEVPDDVHGAYERLVEAGYTKRLIAEAGES
ncbi:YdcF family protein [Myceligenerans salitolerans]|uniref:YdcF family protein n=1 Tax=Myceligenerans salitolerans TaxID=1230528 RepID=A0ABS3I479_9MICO|nr:YdcF family protein [Myceligenerans salitolerans]MBO0607793.1 YdcF family protein [Myceligenerans salitolerans]